jgi:2'-5' RNA ligase
MTSDDDNKANGELEAAWEDVIRTFVAIKLPSEVKELLKTIQTGLDRGLKGVSWVKPESIHLTLKFLGEIDDAKVQKASAELLKAAAGIGPFKVELEGVGSFPNPRNPRVVWAGVRENIVLLKLYKSVEERLTAVGFEADDRPFAPHLTLCRIKSAEDGRSLGKLLGEVKPEAKAAFTVSSFVFMKSVLKPSGAEHTSIQEFALMGQNN